MYLTPNYFVVANFDLRNTNHFPYFHRAIETLILVPGIAVALGLSSLLVKRLFARKL